MTINAWHSGPRIGRTSYITTSFLVGFLVWVLLNPAASFAKESSSQTKRVHIVVVLADNTHQGIVPIAETLGDGFSPQTNLYWGALYGVKSYFNRQAGTRQLKQILPKAPAGVLDQVLFEIDSPKGPVIVLAEAWQGDQMNQALHRYYTLLADPNAAELIVFVGHNGLMDHFVLPSSEAEKSNISANKKDTMVLACKSKSYFSMPLSELGPNQVLMTKGLMAPEAYSLHAAIIAWAENQPANEIRLAAANAYAAYQNIPKKNARWLFDAKLED
jgi:hypothetical protein